MKKLVAILLIMLSIVGLSSCLGGVEFELNFVVDSKTYDTVSTNGKEIVKMPSDPTKDGYTFDGWYWDKGTWQKPFTANSLLDAPLSSDMSVYAKWKVNEQEHVHTPSEWIEDTPATCKSAGSKHKKCTECEEVLETEEIEKLTTHTPAEAVKENYVDSDCETEGSYNSVVYCSVCDAKISSEAKTVDKKEHTPSEWIIDTEATCKAAGSKHKECTECEALLETEEIEKLTTHTPAEAVKENYVDSDCETEGSYNSVVYCSVCDAKISSEAKTVDKKEHTPSEWIIDTEATCKSEGSKHKECTECEEVLETEEIEKLTTHTYTNDMDIDCNVCGEKREISCQHNNTTIIPGKSASCSENGLTDGLFCNDCKQTVVAQTVIPASHKEIIIPRIDPECNQCGWTEGKECELCYKVIVSPEIIRPLGCKGGDWITVSPATEFDSGARIKKCIRCGEDMQFENIPATVASLSYEVSFDAEDGVEYITIISASVRASTVTLPSQLNGLPVLAIADGAFAGEITLGKVIIPDSVKSIGCRAFEGCTSLTYVSIGKNVEFIGAHAFTGCTAITGIAFSNTNGWWMATSSTATSGKKISADEVSDKGSMMKYLCRSYNGYYYRRA